MAIPVLKQLSSKQRLAMLFKEMRTRWSFPRKDVSVWAINRILACFVAVCSAQLTNNGRFRISHSYEIIDFCIHVKHREEENIKIECLLRRHSLENCFANFERGVGSFLMGAKDRSVRIHFSWAQNIIICKNLD